MQRYRFGLLGQCISYSRSPELFRKIWAGATAPYTFSLIDTTDPSAFVREVRSSTEWGGFTVTTPYKVDILQHLDLGCTEVAQAAGAVNAVRCTDEGLRGHNSDVIGFMQSLAPLLHHCPTPKALVLGTGGATQAVRVALNQLKIPHLTVSRDGTRGDLTYTDLTPSIIEEHRLIIHATPLGSAKYPDQSPPLPYDALTSAHILFDLTYAPAATPFLTEGLQHGAIVRNGFAMLWYQAVEAWRFFSE